MFSSVIAVSSCPSATAPVEGVASGAVLNAFIGNQKVQVHLQCSLHCVPQ